MFIFVFCLILYFVFINIYPNKYKITYIINTILCSIFAAINLTSPGNDWVNNLWGIIIFLCAVVNMYVYKEEKSLKKH